MSASTRQPHFAALLCLAWLLVALQLVALHWGETAQTLNDTDDAMRLAQLRDWLGGQGWYDLHQWRVAPGYESHWSRLLDAGLAGTLALFGLFLDGALAERLMRTTWPMLWLLPTMAGSAAIAWRIAGREAALLALLLALDALRRPERIDMLAAAAAAHASAGRARARVAGEPAGESPAALLHEALGVVRQVDAAAIARDVIARAAGSAGAEGGARGERIAKALRAARLAALRAWRQSR